MDFIYETELENTSCVTFNSSMLVSQNVIQSGFGIFEQLVNFPCSLFNWYT